jgi:hypothetical protein
MYIYSLGMGLWQSPLLKISLHDGFARAFSIRRRRAPRGRAARHKLTMRVPAYFTFDVRLGGQLKPIDISLVGQNLRDNQHPEFGALEIPRSVHGKVAWPF